MVKEFWQFCKENWLSILALWLLMMAGLLILAFYGDPRSLPPSFDDVLF